MDTIEEIQRVFDLHKQRYAEGHSVPYAVRHERLGKVERLFRENYREMMQALQRDFGTRDEDAAFLGDIYSPLEHAAHARKHLRGWMKPRRQGDGFLRVLGQRSYIKPEPLGVVGIITPFNAPISLGFDPAIDALAAGNTVMIRFPEAMPATGALMAKLVQSYFDAHELAVVTGELEAAKFFAALPWDKLVFTGGSETGKRILAAAAQNLTPVLLELGGKSPVVVLDDADLAAVAEKVAKVRLMNGGQVCIAGDYALVPDAKLEAFVEQVVQATSALYPTVRDNPQYTSVVGRASFERLTAYVDEARASGARVVTVNPGNEPLPDAATGKFPLTLVVDPDEGLRVSKEEIFGPILPVVPYRTLDEAVAYINRKEKPLALYIFGNDRAQIDHVLEQTSSGGVTVNDLLLHAGSHSMGFGGVGYSGMGRYKGGRVGFDAFSNEKAVVEQGLLGRFSHGFAPPMSSARNRKMLASRVGIER